MTTTPNDHDALHTLIDRYVDRRVQSLLAAEALRTKWDTTPGCTWREDILTYSTVDALLAELDARAAEFAYVMAAQAALTSTEGVHDD